MERLKTPLRLQVAVAVIFDKKTSRVLIGQRTAADAYFGKWEFPGGKIEDNESVVQALARELKEELGVQLVSSIELMTHSFDYPDRNVDLYVRLVEAYQGEIQAQEGQALQWVELKELQGIDMLAGNRTIVAALLKRAM